MTYEIRKILSNDIKTELVDLLLEHYRELKHKYSLGQYEPSQLNCAKFMEVVIRILEFITKGSYTLFDRAVSIDSLARELEQMGKDKLPDSIRIFIPRIIRATYDIRNKRGVAHVGNINPNFMDATFTISASNWIMAEFIRLYHSGDPNEAQKIIDSLAERKVPPIEEFGEDLKILNSDLSVADKVLLILYKKHPSYVPTTSLKNWIKTRSPGHINTVLARLNYKAMIYRRQKESIITRKGIECIERILLERLESAAKRP